MFDLCVIGGCGHVGLPLSIAFALRGKRVAIFDVDRAVAEKLRRGEMPFTEEDGEASLRRALASGRLEVTLDPEVISQSEALVLVLATPIDGHFTPCFQVFDDVLKSYSTYLRDGQLLILRSTLYPGTSSRVDRWLTDNGFKIDVAVCPERLAQGRGLAELFSLPQIISAFSATGLKRVRALFSTLNDDVVEMKPLEAEVSKLFTNAWRYIKFAVANQFYVIANDNGLDFETIYRGMTHSYARAKDLPGPGFASGPCLFKDTMQLAAFTHNNFMLGHAAMMVNESLPQYVVNSIRKCRPDLGELTVGLLGMAFKAEVDDPRDSLSYKLKSLLEMEARCVLCSDPYVQDRSLAPAEVVIEQSHVIVIGTPHRVYRTLDFHGKPVIDIWSLQGVGTQL